MDPSRSPSEWRTPGHQGARRGGRGGANTFTSQQLLQLDIDQTHQKIPFSEACRRHFESFCPSDLGAFIRHGCRSDSPHKFLESFALFSSFSFAAVGTPWPASRPNYVCGSDFLTFDLTSSPIFVCPYLTLTQLTLPITHPLDRPNPLPLIRVPPETDTRERFRSVHHLFQPTRGLFQVVFSLLLVCLITGR